MTIDEARAILKEKCNPLFNKYIVIDLAGDYAVEIARILKRDDKKEFLGARDRASEYARIYKRTESILEYNAAIARILGTSYHQEARVAWESIDQWEGHWRGKEDA